MITFSTIIFFILGLVIGSFLNVVIFRLNTQKSFGGRSACMSCRHQLAWYELIPVFSFIFLGGRCKDCKTGISIQYPLVELTMGIIFAFLFIKFEDIFLVDTFSFSIIYAYYGAMFALLLVIAVYDLKHKIIPDKISFLFGILAFAGMFFFRGMSVTFHIPVILDLFAGLLLALPFYLFWLVSSGRWMGLGDAKLAIGLGWLLGFWTAVSGVILSFWIGAVFGIGLVIFSKDHGMKSEIPFAPYLALGALLAFIFGLHLL